MVASSFCNDRKSALKPPYLPMHGTIFCQKTKILAATSNLPVEQNLEHLGRLLHFSQKVVGVTISLINFVYFFSETPGIIGDFYGLREPSFNF